MIAVAQWLRICMFSMEVPGLNDGKTFFMHLFLLCSDSFIRVFEPRNLQLLGFCLVTL